MSFSLYLESHNTIVAADDVIVRGNKTWRTYDGWRERGRQVISGEQHQIRSVNTNKPLFEMSQTKDLTGGRNTIDEPDDDLYDALRGCDFWDTF